ncbi:hypothetical protein HF650_18790 [Kosakonia sp. SMBL-WEM22]|uniref:hypothetical protein n=1 Tax=Kosakonia sp. SMBL-WEM22 TaxID=2725560 RepID=UPI001659A8B4|nr:hypothetical protein [Kosakonia sp. SMBL-WEM22]QNQ18292.1 hypothetical protein HF650_18790 [Kosakonia sp. SMBL-WEM22]
MDRSLNYTAGPEKAASHTEGITHRLLPVLRHCVVAFSLVSHARFAGRYTWHRHRLVFSTLLSALWPGVAWKFLPHV